MDIGIFNFDKLSDYMLVLADICEEKGEIWKARAWRWLHKNKRTPQFKEARYYFWLFSPAYLVRDYKSRLPNYHNEDVWTPSTTYNKLSKAYEGAAKYMELYLKEIHENENTKS